MKTLKIIAYVWLGAVALLVLAGAVGILLNRGVWELMGVFSPFNILNWLLIALLAAPGLVLLHFAEKPRK